MRTSRPQAAKATALLVDIEHDQQARLNDRRCHVHDRPMGVGTFTRDSRVQPERGRDSGAALTGCPARSTRPFRFEVRSSRLTRTPRRRREGLITGTARASRRCVRRSAPERSRLPVDPRSHRSRRSQARSSNASRYRDATHRPHPPHPRPLSRARRPTRSRRSGPTGDDPRRTDRRSRTARRRSR